MREAWPERCFEHAKARRQVRCCSAAKSGADAERVPRAWDPPCRFINKVKSAQQKLVPVLRPSRAPAKDESRCGAIHIAQSRPETLLARHGLSGLGAEFCASVSEFAGFSATTA